MNRHSNRHASQREAQVAFKVLMTHVFCNSHDVSHFAAFFIVVGAKTSIAESVDYVISFSCLPEGVTPQTVRNLDKFVIRLFFGVPRVSERGASNKMDLKKGFWLRVKSCGCR